MMTNSTTQKIHEWVLQNFPAAAEQKLGVDDSLLDSGIVDSMGTLEIVEYLEDELGIEVSDDDMVADHFESVSSIAKFANKQMNPDAQTDSTLAGSGSLEDDAGVS